MSKICKQCGKLFEGNAHRCPPCRSERITKQSRDGKRRERAGVTKQIGSVDRCAICNQEYTVKSGAQKLCGTCQRDKSSSHAVKKCTVCGRLIGSSRHKYCPSCSLDMHNKQMLQVAERRKSHRVNFTYQEWELIGIRAAKVNMTANEYVKDKLFNTEN